MFLDKFHATSEMKSFLEQTLREGARFLLQQAVENEVNEYEVQTGIGPIAVK